MSSRAPVDVLCAAVGPCAHSPGSSGAVVPSSAPADREKAYFLFLFFNLKRNVVKTVA